MSLHVAKPFIRPLVLASAAFVIHIGAATAADSTGYTPRKAVPSERPLAYGDAQAAARQVLLGQPPASDAQRGAASKTEPRGRPVAYGDAQVAARQVLLGQPHASDAS
jgi:hypothetical protein